MCRSPDLDKQGLDMFFHHCAANHPIEYIRDVRLHAYAPPARCRTSNKHVWSHRLMAKSASTGRLCRWRRWRCRSA